MLGRLRSRRFQVAVAIVMTAALIGVWIVRDYSTAILPALIGAQWISLFAPWESVSNKARPLLIALVGLTLLFFVGTLFFWLP